MPYIVTTRRPDRSYDHEVLGEDRGGVSRHAVATLEEAQDHIYSVCAEGETDDEIIADEIDRMPEQGGTITLPDGTVIEVEQTRWIDLIHASTATTDSSDQAILDAYNARQA
jgi:hypothetical protein